MNFVLGRNPIFKLNTKAKEMLLKNELHKISPDCCKYIKKKTIHQFEKETGLKAILGVRGAEGMMRKRAYQTCFTKSKNFTPLHDLTDDLEHKIYKKYNIEDLKEIKDILNQYNGRTEEVKLKRVKEKSTKEKKI
jgi:hypothetical protein